MLSLSEELAEIFHDPKTVKVLVTSDDNGVPHPVFKGSLTLLDDGMIAYSELIERSRTYKNMLNNYWKKKEVAIALYNEGRGAFQVKGRPHRFIIEGPIWDRFLEETWKVLPEADPAGVWIIEPLAVENLDYSLRRNEEEQRMLNYMPWMRLKGPRSVHMG